VQRSTDNADGGSEGASALAKVAATNKQVPPVSFHTVAKAEQRKPAASPAACAAAALAEPLAPPRQAPLTSLCSSGWPEGLAPARQQGMHAIRVLSKPAQGRVSAPPCTQAPHPPSTMPAPPSPRPPCHAPRLCAALSMMLLLAPWPHLAPQTKAPKPRPPTTWHTPRPRARQHTTHAPPRAPVRPPRTHLGLLPPEHRRAGPLAAPGLPAQVLKPRQRGRPALMLGHRPVQLLLLQPTPSSAGLWSAGRGGDLTGPGLPTRAGGR